MGVPGPARLPKPRSNRSCRRSSALFNPQSHPAAPLAPLFPQALPASLSAPAQNPVELGDGQGWLGVAWVAWTKAVQSELEKTQ